MKTINGGSMEKSSKKAPRRSFFFIHRRARLHTPKLSDINEVFHPRKKEEKKHLRKFMTQIAFTPKSENENKIHKSRALKIKQTREKSHFSLLFQLYFEGQSSLLRMPSPRMISSSISTAFKSVNSSNQCTTATLRLANMLCAKMSLEIICLYRRQVNLRSL